MARLFYKIDEGECFVYKFENEQWFILGVEGDWIKVNKVSWGLDELTCY